MWLHPGAPRHDTRPGDTGSDTGQMNGKILLPTAACLPPLPVVVLVLVPVWECDLRQ